MHCCESYCTDWNLSCEQKPNESGNFLLFSNEFQVRAICSLQRISSRYGRQNRKRTAVFSEAERDAFSSFYISSVWWVKMWFHSCRRASLCMRFGLPCGTFVVFWRFLNPKKWILIEEIMEYSRNWKKEKKSNRIELNVTFLWCNFKSQPEKKGVNLKNPTGEPQLLRMLYRCNYQHLVNRIMFLFLRWKFNCC